MKKLCSFVVLSMLATTSMAQTQFWVDDFESASPSSGSRNPAFSVSCGGPPATAYFNRVGTANISTGTVYTGFQGSSFWAIEDIDKGPTCVNNSVTAHQNITWQGINIAGKLGLSFKGLFAVGTTTSFDGFGMVNSGGTSKYDYLIVQYRIDGGAWTDLLRFFPSINNAGNGTLAIETTGDSIAQGEGTSLTTVASEFSANIAGTGVTLELQIKTHSNSAAEEILLDNFRFFETVASPEINLQGNSNSIIDGDATPTTTDHTDFGSQSICSGTIVRTFTIQNTGASNLTVNTPTLSGTHAADFSVTANPSSPVSASGSTTFQVTFNPSASGTRSATVTITNGDSDEGTYDFAIQGTGTDPEVNVQGNSNSIADGDATPTSTDHTDFGSQSICSGTIVRTFTIQNTGTSDLTLANPSISGTHAADFSVTANPSTPVSAAGSTTFQVTFNPSASGTRSATVTFTNNDCDEATYDFAIQGTGTDGTPTILSTTGGSTCGTGTAQLSGTVDVGTIDWYDAPVGGNLVGTGLSITSPIISQNTTYYAEGVDGSCTSATRTAVQAEFLTTATAACVPSTVNTGDFGTGIIRFQFNTIDNVHNDFNNDGTQNFTCSQMTEVERGNTYAFTLTGYGGNSEYARIYVDYDNSGTFEVGESVYTQNSTRQAAHTGNITIPMTGYEVGTVLRMRVMTNYNAITSGCANLSYGEAEDYGIIIPCHTPTVSSTAPATGCGTGTVVLGATPDVGTIRWYDAATAGTLLGTGTTFTTPSIAATTTYYAEALYGTCTSARTAVVATVDATCLQWTGTTDTDWNTSTNWNGNTVPAASNNVLIPDVSAGSGNFPVVSTSGAEANDVTTLSGASLTIGAAGDLTINGDLSNTGTVIVGAEGSGIGSLITLGAVSGAGVFQADQYLQGAGAATPNGVFQYVSSPVIGATSTTYDAEGTNKLWSASEATQTYTEITDGSTTLNVGEGYVARVGFDGAHSLTGTAFNTGNVNIIGLTRTGSTDPNRGYNLIGNPYPSSVNWSSATRTNVETTLWYRTHTAGNAMVTETFNATGGIGTNNGNFIGANAVGIIPPGQGFWVRVVDGQPTGSVSFTNAMRSHGTQASIYKQEAEEGTVRLNLSNGTISDETIVHFTTDAEDSYDDFDSQKMWMNSLPQLYTTTGTDSLVINGLYSIETNPIVDLGIKAPTTGNYTITASSITLNEEVWLEDRALNNFQHLNVNPVYAFTTDAGNIGDRFALHFGMMAVGIGRDAINGVSTHVFAADGMVNVSVGNDITTGTITILDMAGRTVQTAAINGSRTVVATDLVTGIYLVRVETEKGGETHRVVVR